MSGAGKSSKRQFHIFKTSQKHHTQAAIIAADESLFTEHAAKLVFSAPWSHIKVSHGDILKREGFVKERR